MAKAQLLMTTELERAFSDAQNGKVRFIRISIVDEDFTLTAVVPATAESRRDCEVLVSKHMSRDDATFVLGCLDVNVSALRWILLAYVPDTVSVRNKMLYSSSRESLKKHLGLNYFVGEFHVTDLVR